MNEGTMSMNETLALYADGPRLLEAALAGLPPSGLDLAPESGGWTIRQIVHHLADGDDIWKVFIKRTIGNQSGEFTLDWYWQFPQDDWAERWAYATREIEPSLALLHASRSHVVQLLEQVPGAWEKCLLINWPGRYGEMVSVHWVVEMQARHVVMHIDDIRKLRLSHGV